MERLQTGQDRSSTSKVSRLNTVPTGQRYAMVMPSYFSSLSRFNAKKPSLYQHDMQRKTILAFRRIVQFYLSLLSAAVLLPCVVLTSSTFLGEWVVGWVLGCTTRVLLVSAVAAIGVPLFQGLAVAPGAG